MVRLVAMCNHCLQVLSLKAFSRKWSRSKIYRIVYRLRSSLNSFFDNGNEHVSGHTDPYLSFHGVLGSAEK